MNAVPHRGTALPELLLVAGDRRLLLSPSRPFVVGRGSEADLDLDHPNVSRRHLLIEAAETAWRITDESRNGTFSAGTRICSQLVTSSMTLVLGGIADGATLELRPRVVGEPAEELRAARQGRLSTVVIVERPRITIGRLPDNDVVLDDLLVSRRHAELVRDGDGWTIVDLGSPNGTFVNGRRIDRAPVGPRDVVGIGRALLHMQGDRLVSFIDNGGNVFAAEDLCVTTAKGKQLLRSVGFELPARSLLAVIGPSGAGKSTLLNALTGVRPADSGSVHYAGRDLYEEYDELRHRIALVPQDDVLHTQLTVRQALNYAAQLRFPVDAGADDRRHRVDEVIAELGLTVQAEQRITSLSGGQRKRTSVALELLTKPSLLLLDEPTSGLDPGMDRSVMRTLRSLANEGRTVVVVTHSVSNLEICDNVLLLAPGGWVAYFGPPNEALRYFSKNDFIDIFLMLEGQDGEQWARRFQASTGQRDLAGVQSRRRVGPPPSSPPRQQSALNQLGVLCRRYLTVIAFDRQYLAFLVALPLVLSLLAWAVPGTAGLSVNAALPTADPQPRQLLLVLIVGATLMGIAASMRELVKERPIYLRERAIGLSIGAYLTSKVLILTVLAGIEAVVFTMLALLGRNAPDTALLLKDGTAEVVVAVVAVAIGSMLTGLLISAVISNADRGMPLMVVLVMVQLILCGGLFGVAGRPGLEQASWLVPSRWAYAMAASTTDAGRLNREAADPLWRHSVGIWLLDATLLVVFAVIVTLLVAVLIRRLDPQRRRKA